MNTMLKNEAIKYGDRLQIVDIKHLKDLKNDIDKFQQNNELNGFQKWIVEELYDYTLPKTEFEIKSIIIVAIYHPFYADIEFMYKNKKYHARNAVAPSFKRSKDYLRAIIQANNKHIEEVVNLPMKRLAVQGGLAVYGRNNVTYIEGLGSNISYMAFYSDVECDNDEWREVCNSDLCDNCNLCINNCPTQAILKERFLIKNVRCLSCINEGDGEFPDWLPKDVHHTFYDCLRCQEKCPMNKEVSKDVIGPICFSEDEINMLLQGKKQNDFSDEFNQRASQIGLFYWCDSLPRNIMALIDVEDKKSLAQ